MLLSFNRRVLFLRHRPFPVAHPAGMGRHQLDCGINRLRQTQPLANRMTPISYLTRLPSLCDFSLRTTAEALLRLAELSWIRTRVVLALKSLSWQASCNTLF